MIPRATYRVQFHRGFTFADGARLAPYLAQLGISHLYASPILQARIGSTHGYDVIDPRHINSELGGEGGFRAMSAALKAHGIGIILDIVPNHMAVGGADNPWWLDVLEKGAASPVAQYFDIDWNPPEAALHGKILVPFLGEPYGEILKSGQLKLVWDDNLGGLTFAYHEHRFPLRAESCAEICGEAVPQTVSLRAWQSPTALHRLLEAQHFRLAWWRTAPDQINWRRFFNINSLAALRVEDERVFEAVHAKIFGLCAEGLIDGLRVDHVDGLASPGEYCRLLRQRLEERIGERPDSASEEHVYIVVEKILASSEALPADWGVDGTTGYEVMNDISAVQHDPSGAEPLSRLWTQVSNDSAGFDLVETCARREILISEFESALDATARSFHAATPDTVAAHDISLPAIRRALISIIEHFRVYRCYGGIDGLSQQGHLPLDAAIARSLAAARPVDAVAIDHIRTVMNGPESQLEPERKRAVRYFNQLTAPVAAKASEDTAFYRYGRLLSRNDVGFDPGIFSLEPSDFHARMKARAQATPHALSATATHDHKRGEDARARLAVLSEIAGEWAEITAHWFKQNAWLRSPEIDPGDEYQLYQTLVGAWPVDLRSTDRTGLEHFSARICAWREKSLREAKLRTSWADPDADFEAANQEFVSRLLDPDQSSAFLNSLTSFVDRTAPAGALNSLVQTALRITLPGVPDLYQGCEFWDLSLVDPDNRRPVDFAERQRALAAGKSPQEALNSWRDGHVKQALIMKLLHLRTKWPDLFTDGDYEPLPVAGPKASQVAAFLRRKDKTAILVAVPRLVAKPTIAAGVPLPDPQYWRDTKIVCPPGKPWRRVIGEPGRSALTCTELFAHFPVAVLIRTP